MKNTVYLLLFLLLFSCKGNSSKFSTAHSETKSNLRFSFIAYSTRNGSTDINVKINVELSNVGKDTFYFYDQSYGSWIDDNPVNLNYYFTGVKPLDSLPEIMKIAPKETVTAHFNYYVEPSDLMNTSRFGITCYPVDQNLKHRKKLVFNPATINVQI